MPAKAATKTTTKKKIENSKQKIGKKSSTVKKVSAKASTAKTVVKVPTVGDLVGRPVTAPVTAIPVKVTPAEGVAASVPAQRSVVQPVRPAYTRASGTSARPSVANSSGKGRPPAADSSGRGRQQVRPVQVRPVNGGRPAYAEASAGKQVVPPVQPQVIPGQTELVGGRTVWRSTPPTYNDASSFASASADRPVSRSQMVGGNGNGNGYGRSVQPNFGGEVDGRIIPDAGVPTETITGILEVNRDGNGVLRTDYAHGDNDAYISGTQIRRFRLRPGDEITGPARAPKENEQFWGLLKVEKVNGKAPDKMEDRVRFGKLTPVFPDEKLVLETNKETLATRLIDLVAPIGRGQRGLIVSPPKAGKTTVLKDMATGIAANYKDVLLMAVLIGERPEEVTDIKRHIAKITDGKGEVAASNFDEPAEEQARIAELALERAKRLVELGENVVILLDSITRLARAFNLAIPTSGRTLSGGFDPAALYPPKRFFGAARNFEEFETPDGKKRGSLTILGTTLVDTGSKMDELIYEEFKGTGNMELHLDRKLAERRIYPSIDVQRSGTRREDLLFNDSDYQSVVLMRRMNDLLDPKERTGAILNKMRQTKTNKEFLATLKES